MSKIKKELGVIIAFDMENDVEAVGLARALMFAHGNFVIKIGRPLEMKYGMDIISRIRNATDVPIIYDGKIADIPYISAKIAETAYDYGADAVIMHSFVGGDVVEAVVNLGMGDVITVIEMSHPGWTPLQFPRSKILNMHRNGVDGIVLPATEPSSIREGRQLLNDYNSDMYIISPGIGTQGANCGDAFEAGADYEIIGRKIYSNNNPTDFAEYCYGWATYYENERNMCAGPFQKF